MKEHLEYNEKNIKFVNSLPKIYLVGYWAGYGIREYPFAKKYSQHNVPYVYDFDDHNGTYAEYIAKPITDVTTRVIKIWTFSKDIADELLNIYEVMNAMETYYTKNLFEKITLLNQQSQKNYERYCEAIKENIKLKDQLKKLKG